MPKRSSIRPLNLIPSKGERPTFKTPGGPMNCDPVDRLLRAHEEASDFLQTRITNESPLSKVGTDREIQNPRADWEGGFGVVYGRAKEPVRRRVALKIIKRAWTQTSRGPIRGRTPGARLDGPSQHRQSPRWWRDRSPPAVEGRASPCAPPFHRRSGAQRTDALPTRLHYLRRRPYFVMELVGPSDHEFCDEETFHRPRLELFIAVCHYPTRPSKA